MIVVFQQNNDLCFKIKNETLKERTKRSYQINHQSLYVRKNPKVDAILLKSINKQRDTNIKYGVYPIEPTLLKQQSYYNIQQKIPIQIVKIVILKFRRKFSPILSTGLNRCQKQLNHSR